MYDEKLNEILKDAGIEIIKEDELNDNLELSVKGILTKFCAGKKCALWGAGRMNTISSHSGVLISKYATYLQELVCVIDSEPSFHGKTFLGFPVVSPEEIHNYDIDVVIISSKNSGNSIVESLLIVSPASKYVDIYSELRKKGIEVYNTFFDERSIYTILFDLQKELKHNLEAGRRQEVLKRLITLHFNIRDFYYGFNYIDQYIEQQYSDSKVYENLKERILLLLEEMAIINEKKRSDVSLFYIDALRHIDLFDGGSDEPHYLKRYIRNGHIYSNMYSVGVTTYESMVSTILGKYPMECDVYQEDFLRRVDEFSIISQVLDQGYDVKWMVSDCYRLLYDDPRLQIDIQIYMSKKLWNMACGLAESSCKTFNFVYFPYEIHCPMLCGYHKERPVIRGFSNIGIEVFPKTLLNQYEECLGYMDKQFEFFYELLGKNTKKIIFSDHAQVVYDKDNRGKSYNMYYKYKDLTSHIPFIMSQENQRKELDDNFYSMVDFNHIIKNIIENKTFHYLKKDIIRYQYYPIHSAKIRLHCQSVGGEDYIDGLDIYVSKDYIYIRTGTGKEELYRNDQLEINIIDTSLGQQFKKKVLETYEDIL